MANPDLQIRGLGERGVHPDPETRGGSLKKNFRPFGPQFRIKIREGGAFSSQSVYCYALRPRSHERLIAQ